MERRESKGSVLKREGQLLEAVHFLVVSGWRRERGGGHDGRGLIILNLPSGVDIVYQLEEKNVRGEWENTRRIEASKKHAVFVSPSLGEKGKGASKISPNKG